MPDTALHTPLISIHELLTQHRLTRCDSNIAFFKSAQRLAQPLPPEHPAQHVGYTAHTIPVGPEKTPINLYSKPNGSLTYWYLSPADGDLVARLLKSPPPRPCPSAGWVHFDRYCEQKQVDPNCRQQIHDLATLHGIGGSMRLSLHDIPLAVAVMKAPGTAGTPLYLLDSEENKQNLYRIEQAMHAAKQTTHYQFSDHFPEALAILSNKLAAEGVPSMYAAMGVGKDPAEAIAQLTSYPPSVFAAAVERLLILPEIEQSSRQAEIVANIAHLRLLHGAQPEGKSWIQKTAEQLPRSSRSSSLIG